MNKFYFILPVVVILLIFLLSKINVQKNTETNFGEKYIYGHWIADGLFCKESEISSMQIFIGKPIYSEKKSKVERPAYIIINNEIANQEFTIRYDLLSNDLRKTNMIYRFPAEFEFTDDIDIPENVILEFNIMEGSLRIYDGDTIYGVLYKDHEVTNLLC